MKKYFSKKTGEEIKFGDVVEFSSTKEYGNSAQYSQIRVTFFPDVADDLVKLGFIEVKDVKDGDENPKTQGKEKQPFTSEVFGQQLLQSLYSENKALLKRVQALEAKIRIYDSLFSNISNHSTPKK